MAQDDSGGNVTNAPSALSWDEIKTEIDEALSAAWEAADPSAESALRHVFYEAP